jgi:hypothetical protein
MKLEGSLLRSQDPDNGPYILNHLHPILTPHPASQSSINIIILHFTSGAKAGPGSRAV